MRSVDLTLVGDVRLDSAAPQEADLLANLMQLYAHDLSGTFALDLGVDGRFAYAHLPPYWSEPWRRFPFLIRCGTRVAGFVLATRGSPASPDPDDYDIAEFFVLRRHRRFGVGRRAALLLWKRLAGRWIVRVSEGNAGGRRFWSTVITGYTGGAVTETRRPGSPHAWHVYAFDTLRSP